jgi:hypothetical protein
MPWLSLLKTIMKYINSSNYLLQSPSEVGYSLTGLRSSIFVTVSDLKSFLFLVIFEMAFFPVPHFQSSISFHLCSLINTHTQIWQYHKYTSV